MAEAIGLNTLTKHKGIAAPRKRICRGPGSGTGKTGGRGYNGQKARSGSSIPASFEGGQMPIHMRLPKFGFLARKNANAAKLPSRVLNDLKTTEEVTLETLKQANIIQANIDRVKFYFAGEITKKFKITDRNISFSKGCADFLALGDIAPLKKITRKATSKTTKATPQDDASASTDS